MGHLYIAMQFGISTAAFIIVAYKGGVWLDLKFDTYPAFSILLILFSIFYSFFNLIDKMNLIDERKGKNKDKL